MSYKKISKGKVYIIRSSLLGQDSKGWYDFPKRKTRRKVKWQYVFSNGRRLRCEEVFDFTSLNNI